MLYSGRYCCWKSLPSIFNSVKVSQAEHIEGKQWNNRIIITVFCTDPDPGWCKRMCWSLSNYKSTFLKYGAFNWLNAGKISTFCCKKCLSTAWNSPRRNILHGILYNWGFQSRFWWESVKYLQENCDFMAEIPILKAPYLRKVLLWLDKLSLGSDNDSCYAATKYFFPISFWPILNWNNMHLMHIN